jgi:hypothetical protein
MLFAEGERKLIQSYAAFRGGSFIILRTTTARQLSQPVLPRGGE